MNAGKLDFFSGLSGRNVEGGTPLAAATGLMLESCVLVYLEKVFSRSIQIDAVCSN